MNVSSDDKKEVLVQQVAKMNQYIFSYICTQHIFFLWKLSFDERRARDVFNQYQSLHKRSKAKNVHGQNCSLEYIHANG